MKTTKFISAILFTTALSFAAVDSSVPESDVPTPAERQGFSKESPNLGQKEREDWMRMREERKQAREEILSRLRESPARERQNIRQDLSRNRDEMPREPAPFYGRPDSRDMNSMRDQGEPPKRRDHMGR